MAIIGEDGTPIYVDNPENEQNQEETLLEAVNS
jgi:hypothetical protein